MTKRSVKVEVSMKVEVEKDTAFDARAEVASRVKNAAEKIEGKTDGIAVGTSGGQEVNDE